MTFPTELIFFASTVFLISISPGLCMSLALTLGIQVGFYRTLYMMMGELLGVALIAVVAVAGVGAIMQSSPAIFDLLKWGGASYLLFLAIQGWRTSAQKATLGGETGDITPAGLFFRGLVTAVSNPKGWAFSASFLPAFINAELSLISQAMPIIGIILVSELICMCLYAGGGSILRRFVLNSSGLLVLNRVSAVLLVVVAALLVLQ